MIRNILFFEVCTTGEEISIKLWKVKYAKDQIYLDSKQFDGIKSLEKWKHNMAVLFVTGNLVVSKQCVKGDAYINKITENEELFWDMTLVDGGSEQVLSFVRKEMLQDLLEELKKNRIYIIKTLIRKRGDSDIKALLKVFYREEMNFRAIRKSPPIMQIVCDVLYHKLQLPILILFFFTLLGNYFANAHFRRENEIMQTQISIRRKSDEAKQHNESKLSRLVDEYQKMPDCSFSLIADRIASYVPTNLRLNMLSIFPFSNGSPGLNKHKKGLDIRANTIIVKGWVETPGSVTLFSQLLSADNLFAKVEIVSLARRKNASFFDFELQITL
ncbi:MAG: hypothetical protein H6Q13_2444 [Bacteroidetes bacterium]|jgi:hypothetical protein|nr:hypothetical protein [Bacteroidota bacterium]